ncbi:MAG: hypothetical protein ACYST5_22980 [Planctomycetota bacterium]|jgi:hypothetical protein
MKKSKFGNGFNGRVQQSLIASSERWLTLSSLEVDVAYVSYTSTARDRPLNFDHPRIRIHAEQAFSAVYGEFFSGE